MWIIVVDDGSALVWVQERTGFWQEVSDLGERGHKTKYPYLWACIYGMLLTGYAVFTLLDAFVIPRDLIYFGETGQGESPSAAEPVITDTSYESSSFSINITAMREYDTQIYIADVTVSDVSCLRAGLAGGAFGRNIKETTSVMAEDNNAILAVNGDYYGFRDSGFVVRNGYLYRDTARKGSDNEILVVYGDGRFEIVHEAEADAAELVENGAQQVFSFGPGLVREGEVTVGEDSEVGQAMQSNPRTAIGMVEPLHYILLVSDGRTRESAGLTLFELAEVMQGLGCETAYNLDGGGSSTMWFMGEIINVPTSGRGVGERSVSDIVYIGE